MKYSRNLDYFKGKYCTLFVPNINWRFEYTQMVDYFTGTIEKIDEDYVWLKHSVTGFKTCTSIHSIISIAEEQMFIAETEEEKKMIEEYKNAKKV